MCSIFLNIRHRMCTVRCNRPGRVTDTTTPGPALPVKSSTQAFQFLCFLEKKSLVRTDQVNLVTTFRIHTSATS